MDKYTKPETIKVWTETDPARYFGKQDDTITVSARSSFFHPCQGQLVLTDKPLWEEDRVIEMVKDIIARFERIDDHNSAIDEEVFKDVLFKYGIKF